MDFKRVQFFLIEKHVDLRQPVMFRINDCL